MSFISTGYKLDLGYARIFKVFFLVLACSLCLSIQAQEVSFDGTPLQITYPQDTLDLGIIQERHIVIDSFIITNHYTDTLHIKQIYSSCGCTTPQYEGLVLQPGEPTAILFKFNSTGWAGIHTKQLVIFTSKGSFELHFKAQVEALEAHDS